MAVKVSLEHLENAWKSETDITALSDGNGVLFLSSLPAWKYKTLGRLSGPALEEIGKARQYDNASLEPIGLNATELLEENVRVVTISAPLPGQPRPGDGSYEFLEQRRPIPGTRWQILLFSSLERAKTSGRYLGLLFCASAGLVTVFVLYLRQRWRVMAAEVGLKEVLQRAHDRLEQDVNERTADLVRTNERLQSEIAERIRAEGVLRDAQNGLVQAEKMAVLGQMSAGITHELNQPLTALRTLSDNAQVLIERNRISEARKNLVLISDLIGRMGTITSRLKAFARKSRTEVRPISLRRAATNALFIVEQQQRAKEIEVRQEGPEKEVFAYCDGNKLEQVLVNLLTNAFDAVADCPTHRVTIGISTRAVERSSE